MHYSVAEYVGSGRPRDPFRPVGSEQPDWAAIDLRPDCSVRDGYALVATPERIRSPHATHLGDDLDDRAVAPRRSLGSRLGLTLASAGLRAIALELLTQHAYFKDRHWKPLQPNPRTRRWDIWLGERIVSLPVLAGGSVLTESFNTADSPTLGPDLTWTEVTGDFEILSNRINLLTTGARAYARAESDLATPNHRVVLTIATRTPFSGGGVIMGAVARFSASATTGYYNDVYGDSNGPVDDEMELNKVVANSASLLAFNSLNGLVSLPQPVEVRAYGSTVEGWFDGVLKKTVTDTAIPGNTRAGVYGFRTTSSDHIAGDNLLAEDLSTDAPDRRIRVRGVGIMG